MYQGKGGHGGGTGGNLVPHIIQNFTCRGLKKKPKNKKGWWGWIICNQLYTRKKLLKSKGELIRSRGK